MYARMPEELGDEAESARLVGLLEELLRSSGALRSERLVVLVGKARRSLHGAHDEGDGGELRATVAYFLLVDAERLQFKMISPKSDNMRVAYTQRAHFTRDTPNKHL